MGLGMLVRLTKDQIVHQWDTIKVAVRESLPPIADGAEDRMSRILSNMVFGTMQVWISQENNQMSGLVVTTVTEDGSSGIKNLLIYCGYSFREVSRREFVEGIVTLKKYAKGKGCSRIVTYTTHPGFEQLFTRLGGEAIYRFLTLPVGE